MKKLYLFLLLMLNILQTESLDLVGAGSTIPNLLLSTLLQEYEAETKRRVIYLPIGDGLGLKQLQDKSMDFIITEKPFTQEEIKTLNLIQFPLLFSGIVFIVNSTEFKAEELVLDAETIIQIYLGNITKWNDTAIQNLNPMIALPDQEIKVIHRGDSSGTTYLISSFFKENSPEWEKNVGADLILSWPTGVPATGNEGVVNMVQRIEGSIGYVEYSHATQNNQAIIKVLNREKTPLRADIDSFKGAIEKIEEQLQINNIVSTLNLPGLGTWPIMGLSYVVMRADLPQDKMTALKDFILWFFSSGRKTSNRFGFELISERLIAQIKEKWLGQVASLPSTPLLPQPALPPDLPQSGHQ